MMFVYGNDLRNSLLNGCSRPPPDSLSYSRAYLLLHKTKAGVNLVGGNSVSVVTMQASSGELVQRLNKIMAWARSKNIKRIASHRRRVRSADSSSDAETSCRIAITSAGSKGLRS